MPEFGDPRERADEGELSEVAGELVLAGEPVGEAVDTVHVDLVQLALRAGLTRDHPRDQLSFVHAASTISGNSKRRH